MLVVERQREISHPNSPAECNAMQSSCVTITALLDIYVKAHFCVVSSPAALPIPPMWAPAKCWEMLSWEEAVGAQSLSPCSELTH